MSRNPYFDSILLFDRMDIEESKLKGEGKLVIVSESYDYLQENPSKCTLVEDLSTFLEYGNILLKVAGLELSLSEEDVNRIIIDGRETFRFKDLFTIFLNNMKRDNGRNLESNVKAKIKDNLKAELVESFIGHGSRLKNAHECNLIFVESVDAKDLLDLIKKFKENRDIILKTCFEKVSNKSYELSKKEEELFKIISLFNGPVPAGLIKEISGLEDSRSIIDGLVINGILQEVPVEGYIALDFTSSFKKKDSFNELKEEEIKKISKKSISLLMEDELENREEIIHHIELSKDWNLYREYTLNLAINFRNLKRLEESIKYLRLSLEKTESIDEKAKIYDYLLENYDSLGNFDEQDKVREEVRVLAEETGNIELFLMYYQSSISLALLNNDYKLFEELFEKFKYYVEKSGDKVWQLKLLRSEAKYLTYQGKYEVAEKIYREIINKSEGLEEANQIMSNSLIELGIVIVYRSTGNFEDNLLEAAEVFEQGRRFTKKIGEIDGEVLCINNLASVQYNFGNYRLVIEDYLRALDISERVGLLDNQILLLYNIAATKRDMGELESAYKYAVKSLELIEANNIPSKEAYALRVAASIANRMNWIDEAGEYFSRLEELIKFERYNIYELFEHYITHSYFLLQIMDYKKLKYISEDLYVFSKEEKEKKGDKYFLLRLIIDIYFEDDYSLLDTTMENIMTISKSNRLDFQSDLNTVFHNLHHLFKIGDLEKLSELLELAISFNDRIDEENFPSLFTDENWIFLEHFKFLAGIRDEKGLVNALNYCRNNKFQLMKIDILTDMGEYYMEEGHFDYGLFFLLEATKLIQKTMGDISNENKLGFFNGQGFFYPLRLLENTMKDLEKPSMQVMVQREEMEALLSFDYSKYLDTDLIGKEYWKFKKEKSLSLYNIEFIESPPYFYYMDNTIRKNLLISLKYFTDNSLAKNATCYVFNDSGEPTEYISLYDMEKDYSEEKIIKYIMDWKEEAAYRKIDLKVKGSTGSNSIVFQPLFKEDEIGERGLFAVLVLEFDWENNYSDSKYCSNKKSYLNQLSFSLFSDLIRTESNTDKLTGLLSRKRFEELAKGLLVDESKDWYFLMYDIDNFKNINDKYGHRFGDTVLKMITDKVMSMSYDNELLGRVGGEEFMLIVPGEKKDIVEYAESIRLAVASIDYEPVGEPDLITTISIGIAKFLEDGKDYQSLYENSDKAMYKSKLEGKNRVSVYEKGLVNRDKKIGELAGILSEDEISNSRNIRTITEILKSTSHEGKIDPKIILLKNLKSIFNSNYGALLKVRNGRVEIIREIKDNNINNVVNSNLVLEVYNEGKPIYSIDWGNPTVYNSINREVEWNSVMVLPVEYDCQQKK